MIASCNTKALMQDFKHGKYYVKAKVHNFHTLTRTEIILCYMADSWVLQSRK